MSSTSQPGIGAGAGPGRDRGVAHPIVFPRALHALWDRHGLRGGDARLPAAARRIEHRAGSSGVLAFLFLPQNLEGAVGADRRYDAQHSSLVCHCRGHHRRADPDDGLVPLPRIAGCGLLDAVVFVTSIAFSVVGMATENLMAHSTSPQQKGRAAGWCQAGALGGQGLGGGAGPLALAARERLERRRSARLHLRRLLRGAVDDPPPRGPSRIAAGLSTRLVAVGRDVWSVARSRAGFLAAFLVFMAARQRGSFQSLVGGRRRLARERRHRRTRQWSAERPARRDRLSRQRLSVRPYEPQGAAMCSRVCCSPSCALGMALAPRTTHDIRDLCVPVLVFQRLGICGVHGPGTGEPSARERPRPSTMCSPALQISPSPT